MPIQLHPRGSVSESNRPFPACRINGLTHLNLAKLDVLDTLDEVKIGVRYRAKDGTILSSVPADLEILEGVTVGGAEPTAAWISDLPSVTVTVCPDVWIRNSTDSKLCTS